MSAAPQARAEEPFRFGRLRLDAYSLEDAARWILDRAAAGEPALVVTPNIHHLRLAGHDEVFARILESAELSAADGAPLILAARLSRRPLPERVAGIDLVGRILAGDQRLRLAVLGGPPGTAEALAEAVRGRHDVVLVDPLTPGTWESDVARSQLAGRLAAAGPNLVLIGIGAPRQEELADELRQAARGPIICCGAAIEVLAGMRPRAPRALQRVGLEWVFRASLEPKRLIPRYFRAGSYFLRVLVTNR
jgi:N-acetylglucosaminyldiphosphoundecaprenol N-acetyl-beta-D-mannosaminyltransferase